MEHQTNKKKLLGIVGSYRKLGNCEIVAKSVAEKLGNNWKLCLMSLPRLRIEPCKGCYVCLLPEKQCNIKDDVQWILDRIVEADAIIFAAPNYVLGPVGIVKMLADRALQTKDVIAELNKKKTAVALTLGREDYRGYSDTALTAQLRVLGLKVVSLEHFYGTFPGEAVLVDDYEGKIANLATSLQSETYEQKVPQYRCPICFSDLFRIRDEYLECAICRSRAKYENNTLQFVEFGTQFTDEGQREHFEWLAMKKGEYIKIKDDLQEVQNKYRDGNWITPD